MQQNKLVQSLDFKIISIRILCFDYIAHTQTHTLQNKCTKLENIFFLKLEIRNQKMFCHTVKILLTTSNTFARITKPSIPFKEMTGM